MTNGNDGPGSLDDTQPSEQRQRRRLALFVALGLLVAGGIGAAVALAVSGGNDDTVNTVSASGVTTSTTDTTTTGSTGTTAVTTTPAASTVPKGGTTAPPTVAPVQPPAGGSTSQPAPATTAPPPTTEGPTTTTQPLQPKPEFTAASASPGAVLCQAGKPAPSVTVNYTATNSTEVKSSTGAAASSTTPQTLEGSFGVTDACVANDITLTASGPGGSTTTTVSWSYLSPPP